MGGREVNLGELQHRIFEAGADGTMVGNYLTSAGGTPQQVLGMVEAQGLTLRPPATGRWGFKGEHARENPVEREGHRHVARQGRCQRHGEGEPPGAGPAGRASLRARGNRTGRQPGASLLPSGRATLPQKLSPADASGHQVSQSAGQERRRS